MQREEDRGKVQGTMHFTHANMNHLQLYSVTRDFKKQEKTVHKQRR